MLAALSVSLQPRVEITIVEGDDVVSQARLRHAVASRYLPSAVVVPVRRGAGELTAVAPWTAEMTSRGGPATAYVCCDFVCEYPVTAPEDLVTRLDALTQPGAGDDRDTGGQSQARDTGP